MKKLIIGFLAVFLVINAYSQAKDHLKIIAERLSSYKTYKTNCNYTFIRPDYTRYFESSFVTQQIPKDTLSGFYYSFETNNDFGDFHMYFKDAFYSSYKGKVEKTSFDEKPEKFVNIETVFGYTPAIQRTPLFYMLTPYELAKEINRIIKRGLLEIIQMPDTTIEQELCLRFVFKTDEETYYRFSDNKLNSLTNIEYCFDKSELFPVYYKCDQKSNITNQTRIAQFKNTEVNLSLPDDYFTEENLLPKNWQP